jgi:hypothetical protein
MGEAQARGPVGMRMRLRLRLGGNVAVMLVVSVEVWVRYRRWLIVRVLLILRVIVWHDGRRMWLWRREGRSVMSATAPIDSCARVRPVVKRGRRSGHWVRARVRGLRGTFRGKDATKGKTETVYVGIAVGVLLHRGWGGVVGVVVRLVGGMGVVRGEERMDGSAGRIGPMGRSRVGNTKLTITLKG